MEEDLSFFLFFNEITEVTLKLKVKKPFYINSSLYMLEVTCVMFIGAKTPFSSF